MSITVEFSANDMELIGRQAALQNVSIEEFVRKSAHNEAYPVKIRR